MKPTRSAALRRARQIALSLETSSSSTSSSSSSDSASHISEGSFTASLQGGHNAQTMLHLHLLHLLDPLRRGVRHQLHPFHLQFILQEPYHWLELTSYQLIRDIQADIEAETAAAATTSAATVDGLGIKHVIAWVETGFEPGLAVVESESEPEEVEADDESDAEIQPEGTIEIGVGVTRGIDILHNLPMPDTIERLEQLKESVQGMYGHMLGIPLQRIEDIKSGQREQEAERGSSLHGIVRGHYKSDCPKLKNQNRRNKAAINDARGRSLSLEEVTATRVWKGYYKSDCPKLKNQNRRNKAAINDACGRAYALRGGDDNLYSNVVTGTFLLNNCYVYILFDSGVDRSFVSTMFSALIDIPPTMLDVSYTVKLADGRIARSDTIIRGCTLNLLDYPFNIDLMPIELGRFDVMIGMDWLLKYHAVIVYDENIVCIPYDTETLIIRGNGSNEGSNSRLSIISCTKTQKYIQRGCHVFLAHISVKKTEDKSEEKRLEDVPIVQDFPEVFPKDLPGLPPDRQVKFQIDIVPGATPVA
ncbi:putative reverse transcriptase domain-containing protein [Tanacetum coccineum]